MVNQAGKWRVQVRTLQESRLKPYDPITGRWAGFLGDKNGVVQNPNYPTGYHYVRDNHGNLMTMWNARAPGIWNLPVTYGYDPVEPKLLQVLSQWQAFQQQPFTGVPPHHTTHEWPNSDVVYVQGPQIIPADVITSSGMVVTIMPFYIANTDGTYVYVPNQNVDLTPYRPSQGACWALIAFSPSGALSITTGTVVSGPNALQLTPVQAPPDRTYHCIAAVALNAGQSTIVQSATVNQIADLRWSPDHNYAFETSMPRSDGSPSAGNNDTIARGDHVHPKIPVTFIPTSFHFTGVITPTTLAADQNDYNPPGRATATVMRLSASVPVAITGFAAPNMDGRLLFVHNLSTNAITLKHESALSLAANRFNFVTGADVVLQQYAVAILKYDITTQRWNAVGGQGGGGGGDMLKSVYDVGNTGRVDWSHHTEALQTNGAIDPTLTPVTGHTLIWDGAKYIDAAGYAPILEDLSSQLTGTATHFTTSNVFVGGSLDVFDDGLAQNKPDITEDVGHNGFTLSYAPPASHALFVRYTTAAVGISSVNAQNPSSKLYAAEKFV